MKIAVLREGETGERRVAATPETVKKFVALGADVAVESGAGDAASIADADYEAAGALVGKRDAVLKDADVLLVVQGPDVDSLKGAKSGAVLIGSSVFFAPAVISCLMSGYRIYVSLVDINSGGW